MIDYPTGGESGATVKQTFTPSGNQIVSDPLTISGPNGRIIHSFSLMDRGVNPLDFFLPEQNLLRVQLGDIRFVASFDTKGGLRRLFFVPEYPSEGYRSIRGYLTYFGILLSRPAAAEDSVYQLRAWDVSYRRLRWGDGMNLLKEVDLTGFSDFQIETINRIKALDENRIAKRPNLTRAAMREAVGSATGGRLEMKSFALS